ncbi:MAG: hypothetical protein WBJ92_01625 [Tepidanaerobacteraceae bacterium]
MAITRYMIPGSASNAKVPVKLKASLKWSSHFREALYPQLT